MKKLMLLAITLLTASLNAMEGHIKEKNLEITPLHQAPSLIALCSKKIIQHINNFEDITDFLKNNLLHLPLKAALNILLNLPPEIVNENTPTLNELLMEDISPGLKAAIVKSLGAQIDPTIAFNLFDSALDSSSPIELEKQILGCFVFEHSPNVQSWDNAMKLAMQGPITPNAAKIIVSVFKPSNDENYLEEFKATLEKQEMSQITKDSLINAASIYLSQKKIEDLQKRNSEKLHGWTKDSCEWNIEFENLAINHSSSLILLASTFEFGGILSSLDDETTRSIIGFLLKAELPSLFDDKPIGNTYFKKIDLTY